VRGEIDAIFGGKEVELRQTAKAVTPFGGLLVFLEFLRKVGFAEQVKGAMSFELRSANAIPAVETFTAFVMAVVVGTRRLRRPTAQLRNSGLIVVTFFSWVTATSEHIRI
jgi:hypothetical protein